MDNQYGLVRGMSKKQIKNKETKDMYRDITDALHSKVGEFMAEIDVSEDSDAEQFKEETDKSLKELKLNQQHEALERSSSDRKLMERQDELGMLMSDGLSDLKQRFEQESRERMSSQKQSERDFARISEALAASQHMLEQESRERMSLQRQLEGNLAQVSEALAASQRMQPRGFDELKEMMRRLGEKESQERMSLQRQLEGNLAQISEALAASQRMQPRGFDELKEMMRRVEENCKENCKRTDVSIREDVRRTMQEDARTRSASDQQLNDLHRSVKELEQLQRMQPRGFDELKEMMKRLEDNCKENCKRTDVSIREDVRRTMQEDARTRSASDQQLNDLHRSVKELEQLQRMQPRGFDELKEMVKRLEENSKENCKRTDAAIRDDVSRTHEHLLRDVRSAVQEQAQKQTLSEQRFRERCDQLSNTLVDVERAGRNSEALEEVKSAMMDVARQHVSRSTRLEERCEGLEAALDSIKSVQRDAVPRGVCENLRESLMLLEDRCNTMDVSLVHARSEPAEDMKRLLQEEVRRRKSQERNMDEQLENIRGDLAALAVAPKARPTQAAPPPLERPTQAPPTEAAPTRAPTQMSPPGEMARGWEREERLFPPQQMSSPTQMSPQQMASPQAPPKGMSRGWSREEVRRPDYAGGF